jgi:hypothetical protein
VDESGPIAAHAIAHFTTLAERMQCPVVLTSHEEAGTKWSEVPTIQVQTLTPFKPSEVRDFVALSTELIQLDRTPNGRSPASQGRPALRSRPTIVPIDAKAVSG